MLDSRRAPFVLLDFPRDGAPPLRLAGFPSELIVAREADEVRPALRAVQAAVRAGRYAVGFVSYEAAPAFDPALVVRPGGRLPLLWFALLDEPGSLPPLPPPEPGTFALDRWQVTTPRASYDAAIDAVRAAIARGESYQANFTMRLRGRFRGEPWALYRHLRAAQQPAYSAFLDLGTQQILSASPELFFHWQDDTIRTRPMKGTARRGRWPEEDAALAAWLAASEKNRAENVMIVDLLRNDLSRVAEVGSVRVPELWQIERYRTLFQMTSTVTARPLPGTTLDDIFAALFPCGSITGAPKVSTMRLIATLEETPRELYCGTVGTLLPSGEALFNVAIRTLWLEGERAEYGVGGGITWDSEAADEYEEARTKAALLAEPPPTFALLETLKLEGGNFWLLARHLARLAASARYWEIPYDEAAARAALDTLAASHPTGAWRVRLLLEQEGAYRTEIAPLTPWPDRPPVALAATPVSRHNRFLFHKTTRRALYDEARSARPGAWDVLLWNEEGELTEFTLGNLLLERDGHCWTPPLDSGLLPGVFRTELLARGQIAERVLTLDDLRHAERLWLINSVRGRVEVRLERSA